MSLPTAPRSIVIGVTSAQSLRLLEGFPAYLVSQGWDVHVVCSNPPVSPRAEWSLHSIPMRREPSPLHDVVSLARWIFLLCKLRPTVVSVGTPKAGLLGSLAAWITRRPRRIYMLRGLRLTTTRGAKRLLLHCTERLAMGSATQVQAISHSLLRETTSLGLVAPTKITVLGSGSSNGVAIPTDEHISLDKLEKRRELSIPDMPTIGYVGRLTPDKGVGVLLEALKLMDIAQETQLLLIGPEEEAGYLDSLLMQDDFDQLHINWIGSVPEPARYYPAMDVLCLPTMREGFGNVIIEAAAYGIPSIASRVTGCVDAVVDGVTGVLVAPSDPSALASALDHVLSDPPLLSHLGAQARTRVKREFRREHIWELTERFYQEQLECARLSPVSGGIPSQHTAQRTTIRRTSPARRRSRGVGGR